MRSVTLSDLEAARFLTSFAWSPLPAMRRLRERHGSFVRIANPFRRSSRRLMFVADQELYRTVFTEGDIWRGIRISFSGIRGHASNRLTVSMPRLRGPRHAHYRRLLLPLLSRPALVDMSIDMAAIATTHVRGWPRDTPIDLLPRTEELVRDMSIKLLFGGDHARAVPIAELIQRQIEGSALGRVLRHLAWLPYANRQERAILEWAAAKRGEVDQKDILSVLANATDENGLAQDAEIIGGLTTFIYGASYDTCQNGLAWSLLLLSQHPTIARALGEEIRAAVGDRPPTLERIGDLPLLEGVVRESLRLFPPVPLQARRAMSPTVLDGEEVEKGTIVMVSAHTMCRDPAVFAEPDRFVPERWKDFAPTPFENPVFGAGRYSCPGTLFGMQMMKVGIASLFADSTVALAPGCVVDHRTAITLAPRGRVRVVLRRVGTPATFPRVGGPIRDFVTLPDNP